ncbi:hypothetical protein GCM10025777_58970 [Membranihabitans marinus]
MTGSHILNRIERAVTPKRRDMTEWKFLWDLRNNQAKQTKISPDRTEYVRAGRSPVVVLLH